MAGTERESSRASRLASNMGLHSRGLPGPSPEADSDPSMRNVNSMGSTNPSVRFLSLLRLALPSILLQSGAPLAITFQTALIGRKATELVAAWAIVASESAAAADLPPGATVSGVR